jgi:hypothetical protein
MADILKRLQTAVTELDTDFHEGDAGATCQHSSGTGARLKGREIELGRN